MSEAPIVHILDHGRTLCGFGLEVAFPKDWSEGHLWTEMTDDDHINCPECQKRAKEKLQAEEARCAG